MTTNVNPPNQDQFDPELQQFLQTYRDGAQTKTNADQATQLTAVLTMLVAARRARHLRQADLASKAGMPQSSLARIESGKGNPSLQTLLKLLDALDMELTLRPR